MKVFTGVLFLLASYMLVSTCQGLSIDFTESDYNQEIGSNYVRTSLTTAGVQDADINIQITPLTFSQAAMMPGSPCNGISDGSENNAEVDDFNGTVHTELITRSSGNTIYNFDIEIFPTTELVGNEIFLVEFTTNASVQTSMGCAVARIRNVINNTIKIVNITPLITTENLRVMEDVGEIFLYNITKIVESELPITIRLSLSRSLQATDGEDFIITRGVYTIMPNESDVIVALSILEDDIAEVEESFEIRVQADFPTINTISTFVLATITILDNEVVEIGFLNETEFEVNEGGTLKLCAGLLNIHFSQYRRILLGRLVSYSLSTKNGNAIAGEDYRQVTSSYQPYTQRTCYTIETIDNNVNDPPRDFFFSFDSVQMQGDPDTNLRSNSIRIVINDDGNDGLPPAPTITSFMRLDEDKSISLSWSFFDTRPIDRFTGTIRAGRIEKDERSKRQIDHRQVDPNTDEEVKVKYNFTVSESIRNYKVVDDQEVEKTYEAVVCAVNKNGQSCSDPTLLNSPTAAPLLVTNGRISPGLIAIIIAVVVTSILICCFIVLIVLIVCICCDRDREKSYWPGKAVAKELRGKSPDLSDSFDEEELSYKEL